MIGLAAFVPLVWLGLSGGGFEPIVRGQVGILIWWVLILGLALGLLPLGKIGQRGWTALFLMALLTVWAGVSVLWSDAVGATWIELGRWATYTGVLALGLGLRRDGTAARQIIAGVGAALVLLALVALCSRFVPGWFPRGSADTFEDANRLSYPLGYWNGLGALCVIALPLLLAAATTAGARASRAAATALVPALLLTGYLTFSRAGVVFVVLAALVFLGLAADRVRALAALALGAAGGLVLILLASGREAFEGGLVSPAASSEGLLILAITIVVSVIIGLVAVATDARVGRLELPALTVSPRRAWMAAGAVVLVLIGGGLALGGGELLGNAWTNFKQPGPGISAADGAAERFARSGGSGRYQFWEVALQQTSSDLVKGTGAGSFAVWWLRERPIDTFAQNAHSLYLETLGGLGVVGIELLLTLAILALVATIRSTRAVAGVERTALAAATAGCVVFLLWAGIDWLWQVAVLPAAFLLLLAATIGGPSDRATSAVGARGAWLAGRTRAALALVGLLAFVAVLIPTAGAGQIAASRTAAAAGDLDRALLEARRAIAVRPAAGEPRREEALVLEQRGELTAAVLAAREATDREPYDWQNWLLLSRLERANGDPAAALRARRIAELNNPLSPVFD